VRGEPDQIAPMDHSGSQTKGWSFIKTVNSEWAVLPKGRHGKANENYRGQDLTGRHVGAGNNRKLKRKKRGKKSSRRKVPWGDGLGWSRELKWGRGRKGKIVWFTSARATTDALLPENFTSGTKIARKDDILLLKTVRRRLVQKGVRGGWRGGRSSRPGPGLIGFFVLEGV